MSHLCLALHCTLHPLLTSTCAYHHDSQEEVGLAEAVLLPMGSLLRDTTLSHFKAEHARLLIRVEERYQQTDELVRGALLEHRYADVAKDLTTVVEKMAEAGVDRVIFSGRAEAFNTRVAALLQRIQACAKEEVEECTRLTYALLDSCRAIPPTEIEVADLKERLQLLQKFKNQVCSIKGKMPQLNLLLRRMSMAPAESFPSLAAGARPTYSMTSEQWSGDATPVTPRGTKSRRQKKNVSAVDVWEVVPYDMIHAAEVHLTQSLEEYACTCRERCFSSLSVEPKPRAEDVVAFLRTLSLCKELDSVLAAARPNSGTHPFTEQRKAVSEAVKKKFIEVRDTYSRQVRAKQMAEAQSTLEVARDLLVLRDEFAGDAIKMDDAVEEMRSDFDQKSGAFAQSVLKAINEERFPELNTILLGYRDLTGAAHQEEYNAALSTLMERGGEKYMLATQVIASINDDARGRTEFPPSMEQMAAALRWIEGARCVFCERGRGRGRTRAKCRKREGGKERGRESGSATESKKERESKKGLGGTGRQRHRHLCRLDDGPLSWREKAYIRGLIAFNVHPIQKEKRKKKKKKKKRATVYAPCCTSGALARETFQSCQ